MGLFDSFDDKTDPIISPNQLVNKIDGFPKVAVVAFSSHMITALQAQYQPVQIDEMVACVRIPVYQIQYANKTIAVYCSTLGGPAASGLMEEMYAKGCEKFVFFGSCGVLNHDIAEKSLTVPTAAYRDEGTSYHYMPPSDYVQIQTATKLAAIFTELKLKHVLGKTWTTDAFYRETRGNMAKRKVDGCITVEMECASVMAVGQFRNIPVYQFLYAADSLDAAEWDPRVLGSLPQDAREKLLRIALEVAVRV